MTKINKKEAGIGQFLKTTHLDKFAKEQLLLLYCQHYTLLTMSKYLFDVTAFFYAIESTVILFAQPSLGRPDF